jgi:hypothetical protein
VLQIAVYGLSGMREQLDTILNSFDRLFQCAEEQAAMAASSPHAGTDPTARKEPHPIHPVHPTTRVVFEDAQPQPPQKKGFLGIFGGGPKPEAPNEKLARDLIGVYEQFCDQTPALRRSFRESGAATVQELAVPMDQLRAVAVWLREEERHFYDVP